MRFFSVPIAGAAVIETSPFTDERGSLARTFCRDEFSAHGLPSVFVQFNQSTNTRRGTLRGLHYQADPHPDGKLVRCARGRLFDVMVDLRPRSPTFRRWHTVELDADSGRAFYIPEGCAHGFVTLADDTHVIYHMTEMYYPELARGVRWNNSAFGVDWPVKNPILSLRDATFPDFEY